MTTQTRAKSDRAKTSDVERRAYPVALQVTRAQTGGGATVVEGYASVTEAPYEMWDWAGPYQEVVRGGSFRKTLSETPQVQLLLNHGGLSMAYTRAGTLQLAEDTTGLHMRAEVNPARSDVADMLTALEDGAVDEMSFAFRVTRQEWSPDYSQRDIQEVDIHRGDVSVVNFGANPGTSVSAMRSADFLDGLDAEGRRALMARLQRSGSVPSTRVAQDIRTLAALAERRALAPADATALSALLVQIASADAVLDPLCEALCAADCALDAATATLSQLLGLPNPDPEEMPGMGAPGMGGMTEMESQGMPLSLATALAKRAALR